MLTVLPVLEPSLPCSVVLWLFPSVLCMFSCKLWASQRHYIWPPSPVVASETPRHFCPPLFHFSWCRVSQPGSVRARQPAGRIPGHAAEQGQQRPRLPLPGGALPHALVHHREQRQVCCNPRPNSSPFTVPCLSCAGCQCCWVSACSCCCCTDALPADSGGQISYHARRGGHAAAAAPERGGHAGGRGGCRLGNPPARQRGARARGQDA